VISAVFKGIGGGGGDATGAGTAVAVLPLGIPRNSFCARNCSRRLASKASRHACMTPTTPGVCVVGVKKYRAIDVPQKAILVGRVADLVGRVADLVGRVADLVGRVANLVGKVADLLRPNLQLWYLICNSAYQNCLFWHRSTVFASALDGGAERTPLGADDIRFRTLGGKRGSIIVSHAPCCARGGRGRT